MALHDKYELLYQNQIDVCGSPISEFISFAEDFPTRPATVLDLGCGQGRDSYLFASKGMDVTGVDISPTGIKQMVEYAKKNGYTVNGVVCDILEYSTDSHFNIILLDRTLHMLSSLAERLTILEKCANWLASNGHILIADEPSNIIVFKEWFQNHKCSWVIQKNMKPGYCFASYKNCE